MGSVNNLCIIDDDGIFQFLTKKVIEGTGLVAKVKVFSNGLEAIQFIQSAVGKKDELPDVILLDLMMPIMDGWGFLEEYISLKPKLGKKIIIYIVTSSIDPSDVERARSISEVTDYVIKPVTKEKFQRLIQEV